MKKLTAVMLSIIKLIILKLRYRDNIQFKSIKQVLKLDTEIKVGKEARLILKGINTQSNVHLVSAQGKMEIGKRVSFNRNCIVICRRKIFIGDNCLFGPNVCVYDHDHVYTTKGIVTNKFKSSDVIIESGCWIGAGAIILRGTHIGENAVVGAGAIVKGRIPSNSLVTSKRENNITEIK